MRISTGGLAFPCGYHPEGNSADQDGMTLRDYFAAKAMQGFIGNCDYNQTAKSLAENAYYTADAMIAEREKE